MNAKTNVVRLSAASLAMLCGSIASCLLETLLVPAPCLAAWLMLEHVSGRTVLFLSASTILLSAMGAVLLRWLAAFAATALSHLSALGVSADLRRRMLEHMGRLPAHWHADQTLGGIKKLFSTDLGQVENFIAHHVPDTVSAVLLPVVSLAILLWANWLMGLLLLALLLLCVLVQAQSCRIMLKGSVLDRHNQALEDLNAAVIEHARAMPVIRLFNRGLSSFSRMRSCTETFRDIQTEGTRVYAPRWALFTTLTAMPFTLAAVAGAPLCVLGLATLSEIALFLMLGSVCLSPLTRLARLSAMAAETMQSFARIRKLLEQPVEERGSLKANVARRPILVASDVTVRLGAGQDARTILEGISFTAEPGTITAIVGPSGSGKSTLAHVLAGLESTAGGNVTIDGFPLSAFPAHELARLVSPVFQSPHIFAGTVAENIALGEAPGPNGPEGFDKADRAAREDIMARVRVAARLARCAEFIERLPNGYGTRIGDGGETDLSGGQKQRLALARMAFRRTPVVVLDEAMSFADAENEAEIQAALSALLKDRTVIVVAHRLNTIAGADHILVLDHGRLVERGTHESLLAADGLYCTLWDAHNRARSWTLRTRARTRPCREGQTPASGAGVS